MSKKNSFINTAELLEKTKELLTLLSIETNDVSRYTLAFVHRSVLNENITSFSESNERLEFLGDAVLELAITEMLFREYPKKTEGELTDIRSALVRGRNLAGIAAKLGFSDYILLSKGEVLAGGNENPYILANTFEAFLGALYLDRGFEIARMFVEQHVFSTIGEILAKGLYVDPKSYLQEITQAGWGIAPTYEVLEESGPDHQKNYRIAVVLHGMRLGEGGGSSKKKAEQEAAENAISMRKVWEGKISGK